MLGFIKNIFRRRYLRKATSTNPTGLHPLSEIKSVSIIIDMEDSGADECKEKAISVFKSLGIRTSVYFSISARKTRTRDRLRA